MATESFSRTLATTSDAGTCWALLTDVSRVAGWVTVVGEASEIEALAKYSTVLTDKVGPFKLKADLDIKVPEVEVPHRIRITAEVAAARKHGGNQDTPPFPSPVSPIRPSRRRRG